VKECFNEFYTFDNTSHSIKLLNCFLQIVSYSPRTKLGTLLPEFPSVSDVKLPQNIPSVKVNIYVDEHFYKYFIMLCISMTNVYFIIYK